MAVWIAVLFAWPLLATGTAALQAPPPRVVLILDGSLSMIVRNDAPAADATTATGPTRFDLAIDDLRAALEHLAAQTSRAQFRVMAFGPTVAGGPGLWTFPRDPAGFATAADLSAAVDGLEALRARGPQGTSLLGSAIRDALALRPTRVLVYTDGMPLSSAAGNVPDTQVAILDGLQDWNGTAPKVPIDVVGVGSAVAGAYDFLRALAENSGGYFVSTE